MTFDDTTAPSEDEIRQRDQNWKAAVVVLAIGFATCIVGAAITSQKDHDVAVFGEKVHRGGMFIVLLGMVGFLIGRRLEQILQWLDKMMNSGDQEGPVSAMDSGEVVIDVLTNPPRKRARFQFGLATFFMVTMGIGITFGLLFSLPPILLVPIVLLGHLMGTIALTVVLVYGRGYIKTFCIGALITMLVAFLSSSGLSGYGMFLYRAQGQFSDEYLVFRFIVLGEAVAIFLLGVFGVFVRIMLERVSKNGTSG